LKMVKRSDHSGFEPRILGYLCHWCAYASADLAGTYKMKYPPNVRFIRVPCTGIIHPNFVVYPLSRGIDGVVVLGCHPGECHYHSGNIVAQDRVQAIKIVLEEYGITPERFRLDWCSSGEAERFVTIMREFTRHIRALGPNQVHLKAWHHGQPCVERPPGVEPMRSFGGVPYYWDGRRYRSPQSAQRQLKQLLDRGFEVKLVPEEGGFLIYTRREQ